MRESWEISYCIRVLFARTYVKYLAVEGFEKERLQVAYKTEDLHEWARKRIVQVLEEAENERAGRLPSITAQSVVRDCVDELDAMGLFGTVLDLDAAITRTSIPF